MKFPTFSLSKIENKFKLYIHSKIYTLNKNFPKLQWILVFNEKIIDRGINKDKIPEIYKNIPRIYLNGECVIPGLIDAHFHFLRYFYKNIEKYAKSISYKCPFKWIDLTFTFKREKILETLKKIASQGEYKWVLGQAYLNRLDYKLNKEILDKISQNTPIFIVDTSLHSAVINSPLIKISKLEEFIQDSPYIERDKDTKEITGIIYEDAIKNIEKNIPKIEEKILFKLLSGLIYELNSYGIVGIHDLELSENYNSFPILSKLLRFYPKKFNLRIFSALNIENYKSSIEKGYITGFGNEYLKIGPLKIIYDGALGSETALMSRPYKDDFYGIELIKREELENIMKFALNHGVSLAIHSIGDQATRNIADILEKNIKLINNKKSRIRIEHIQTATDETIEKLSKIGVIFSVQPIHIIDDLLHMKKIFPKFFNITHNYRKMIEKNSIIALGTDAPVKAPLPFLNIYTAITRKSLDNKTNLQSKDNLTLEEALYFYTYGSSYASEEENIKGTLEIGKLADFITLSEDIFNTSIENIKDIKVIETYIGGKKVYP